MVAEKMTIPNEGRKRNRLIREIFGRFARYQYWADKEPMKIDDKHLSEILIKLSQLLGEIKKPGNDTSKRLGQLSMDNKKLEALRDALPDI